MSHNVLDKMHSNLNDLKWACDLKDGILQVLILIKGRYYVVGIDYHEDCFNDRVYWIDSRYDLKFIEIEKWIVLVP